MNINLTLFGQTLAFAIFVWFCMKLVWPPITAAMAARQKKIAEGLDAAGRAQQDLKLAQDKVSNTLRETKEQAAQIIEQANKHANAIIEDRSVNEITGREWVRESRGGARNIITAFTYRAEHDAQPHHWGCRSC